MQNHCNFLLEKIHQSLNSSLPLPKHITLYFWFFNSNSPPSNGYQISWLPKLCLPSWWKVRAKVGEGTLCSTVTQDQDNIHKLWYGYCSLWGPRNSAHHWVSHVIFSFLCGMKKQNPEHDLRYLWMLLLSQRLVPFIQRLVPSIQAGKQSTLAASLWVNNLTPLLNCWSQIGILQGSKYLTAFFGKKEKKPHLFPLSWNLNSSWGHLKQGPQHFARMMSPSAHPTCWAHLTQTSF